MRIKLICIGKTTDDYLKDGIGKFCGRIKHYANLEIVEYPEIKGTGKSAEKMKEEEGKLIMSKIDKSDYLILLDENGNHFTSVEFAQQLQNKMNRSLSSVVFLVGGPFGFSQEIYARANEKISLSKMTFSHQMVRLVFVEQLYRAFTILKGEKYHHI